MSGAPGETAENPLDTELDPIEISRAAHVDTPDVEAIEAWLDSL